LSWCLHSWFRSTVLYGFLTARSPSPVARILFALRTLVYACSQVSRPALQQQGLVQVSLPAPFPVFPFLSAIPCNLYSCPGSCVSFLRPQIQTNALPACP